MQRVRNMPKRPCAYPGCKILVDIKERYCKEHQQTKTDFRPSAYQRGYDHKWQKARKRYLSEHPFCAECLKQGKYTLATDVDHIIAHKGSKILFWSENNWQSLCHSCHSKKTAKEDNGGWY